MVKIRNILDDIADDAVKNSRTKPVISKYQYNEALAELNTKIYNASRKPLPQNSKNIIKKLSLAPNPIKD
jgi:hypothetical protein